MAKFMCLDCLTEFEDEHIANLDTNCPECGSNNTGSFPPDNDIDGSNGTGIDDFDNGTFAEEDL